MDDLEKEISRIKSHTFYNQITVEFNPMVLSKIKANKMDLINKIENKYGMNIWLKEDEKLSYEKYKIIFISQLTFCSKSSIIYNCNAAQKRRKTFFESALMASSKTEEVYFNVRYS